MQISIVTISYNQGEFLEQAILSVLNQGYQNIEYIVVDPGSTDGSRVIIDKYRDRISKIIFEPDKGPADGLNKGFSQATGEIYGFLNSDDILLPGALPQVVDYFRKYQQVDIVSGDSLIIDNNGHELRKSYSDKFSPVLYAYGACVLLQPSTFFRSHAFDKVGGFNIENNRAWDGELWVDMGLQGMEFRTVRKLWSGFRLHESAITASAGVDDPINIYFKYIFHRIMNREPRKIDHLIGTFLRLGRHIFNPRDSIERLFHGSIYRRCSR